MRTSYKLFPDMMCHFKFMDSNGQTFPPSVIVRKYKKTYDSMTPNDFLHWLYNEKNLSIFYC